MRPAWIVTTGLLVAMVVFSAGCGRDPKPLEPDPLLNPVPDTIRFTSHGTLTSEAVPIDIGIWGVPDLADIDGDNDLDLFIGDWWGTIWFYRNNGTAQSPRFELETDAYKKIDVGRSAAPEFVDIDDDGDLDLFIGSHYSVGYGAGGLWFFRNVGSADNDTFELVSENYPGLVNTGVSSPAFGDLDGDGDLDLLFAYDESYPDGFQGMAYYRNDGTRQAPAFVLVTIDFLPAVSRMGTGTGIYVYPCLYDLDRDGDLDMLTGYLRQLQCYLNTGTDSTPEWTASPLPEGVSLVPTLGLVPNVVDLNGDGIIDLAIGAGHGFAGSPEEWDGVTYLFLGEK